jgi:hypothetical protein
LATVSQSTTKSSRDVVWDTLEAAIEDLDAFKDYCEATKAAGKGSRLKKQQKQAKSNLANKDKVLSPLIIDRRRTHKRVTPISLVHHQCIATHRFIQVFVGSLILALVFLSIF